MVRGERVGVKRLRGRWLWDRWCVRVCVCVVVTVAVAVAVGLGWVRGLELGLRQRLSSRSRVRLACGWPQRSVLAGTRVPLATHRRK